MYVQGVLGQTPIVAGMALTVMVLGWPMGATLAARSLLHRFGLRRILVTGGLMLPLGALAIVTLQPGSHPSRPGPARSSWASAWGS